MSGGSGEDSPGIKFRPVPLLAECSVPSHFGEENRVHKVLRKIFQPEKDEVSEHIREKLVLFLMLLLLAIYLEASYAFSIVSLCEESRLVFNVMTLPAFLCGAENWATNRADRRIMNTEVTLLTYDSGCMARDQVGDKS
jgi:hypothetical protein